MTQRTYVAILVVLLVALTATACGPATATPTAGVASPTSMPTEQPTQPPTAVPEAVTIRALIRPDEGEIIATYSAKFEQETGIKVQVDYVAWEEMRDKIMTVLAGGGGGYDIIFVPDAERTEILSTDMFEPIDEMIPANERDRWLAQILDLYTYKGHLVAMPWYTGGFHMVYNKEYLEAAGVDPESILTWDDFMDACRKIKEADVVEYCYVPACKYNSNLRATLGTMVWSRGGDFFDAEGNAIFQKEGLASMQLIKDGIEEGLFDPAAVDLGNYDTLVMFGQGQMAFLIDSTWAVNQAVSNPEISTVMDKVGFILIPGAGAGGPRSGGNIYGGGLGLLVNASHKEEAKRFMVYLTSEEAQKQHAIKGANLPTLVGLYEDPDIPAAWPIYEDLVMQISYGKFYPGVVWIDAFDRSSTTAVQDLITGRKSPQEAIDWLVNEADRFRSESQ